MGATLDAIGQWLTQLSTLGQVFFLLLILLPVGGAAAFVLIGATDFIGGYVESRRWVGSMKLSKERATRPMSRIANRPMRHHQPHQEKKRYDLAPHLSNENEATGTAQTRRKEEK